MYDAEKTIIAPRSVTTTTKGGDKPMDIEKNDDMWTPPQKPHEPNLTIGIHDAEIVDIEGKRGVPNQFNENKPRDIYIVTFAVSTPGEGNFEVKRTITNSSAPKSTLSKWAKALGFGDISVTGFRGYDLIGKPCRVYIKHGEPTENGSIWDRVDDVLGPEQATLKRPSNTLDDLANDPS